MIPKRDICYLPSYKVLALCYATLPEGMYIAIDIGGTKTLVAEFDDQGKIGDSTKFATPLDYPSFLQALKKAVKQLPSRRYKACGIGVRGMVDRQNGVLKWDSVLNWRDAAIRDDCAKLLKCPTALENDTKLAGLSEALTLEDTSVTKVLYVTISTGIGTALIDSGKIELSVANSEIGKSVYEHEGVMTPWENFASGKAIVEKYGLRASEIDDPAVWKEISSNLAPGFINICAAYAPDIILVGGGVGAHFDKFQKPLLEAMERINHQGIIIPPVIGAKRPEEAVIYGCYELARQITK